MARASDPNIRALGQPLADASPRRLLRVVGVVDALSERGAMDELIAMIRPPLGRLRPARPLRYPRLLFTPLDPVIAPPRHWRAEDATVPTTAIMPIAASLRAADPGLVAKIEAMIAEHTTSHTALVAAAGARLWPEAARHLLDAPPPVGWDDCGLHIAVYAPLVRRVGAILSSAATIHTLAEQDSGAPGPTEEDLGAVMRRTAEADPDALRAMLIILLNRLPEYADAIVSVAARTGAADGIGKRALDDAAELVVSGIERSDAVRSRVEQAASPDAAANARRMARVLRALDQERAPACMTSCWRRRPRRCVRPSRTDRSVRLTALG